MSTIEISILVAADPTENVHSRVTADGIEVWEVGPMLDRAIADLQAERAALPASHSPLPAERSEAALSAPDDPNPSPPGAAS